MAAPENNPVTPQQPEAQVESFVLRLVRDSPDGAWRGPADGRRHVPRSAERHFTRWSEGRDFMGQFAGLVPDQPKEPRGPL